MHECSECPENVGLGCREEGKPCTRIPTTWQPVKMLSPADSDYAAPDPYVSAIVENHQALAAKKLARECARARRDAAMDDGWDFYDSTFFRATELDGQALTVHVSPQDYSARIVGGPHDDSLVRLDDADDFEPGHDYVVVVTHDDQYELVVRVGPPVEDLGPAVRP
jgi:hypothetical protein